MSKTFELSGVEVYVCPACSTPANGVCVPVSERAEHERQHAAALSAGGA